jgi:transketolase C-terminal domain/subunit
MAVMRAMRAVLVFSPEDAIEAETITSALAACSAVSLSTGPVIEHA